MAPRVEKNGEANKMTGNMSDPISVVHLYRCFDANENLLYIGISKSISSRLNNHLAKNWGLEIKTITVDRFRNLEKARKAEKRLIMEENPKYNFMYSTSENKNRIKKIRDEELKNAHEEIVKRVRG